MSESARSRKSNPSTTTTSEPKSGTRPIVRIPGEGTVLPGGRSREAPKVTRRGLSLRTREVYRRDWMRFANWCKANRVQSLPCRPEALIRYLDERAAGAPRTVLYRELIVICRTHRAEGERSPRQYPLVRKWLRNYQDDPGLPRPSAAPIQAAHFRAMVMRLYELGKADGDSPSQQRKQLGAVRDRALLLLGRGAGLRRLDIRKLTIGDINVAGTGLEIALRRSKSQGGAVVVKLASAKPVAMCPVDAWQQWIADAPGAADAPAFRVLGGSSVRDKPVSPTDVCIVIKRAIHAVGIDPTPYTDDSLAAV